jgi:hypothetical protein
MAHVTVTLETEQIPIATLRRMLDKTDKRLSVRGIYELLRQTQAGIKRGHVRACIASTAASQTVTCDYDSVVDGTDDITIGGTTLSVEASPSGEAQFDGGTTDAELATNLAAAINGNSTINKLVRATASSDVVTITCVYPGPIGNLVTLAETGNGFTLGAAALASGASDEVDSYQFGFTPST